MGRFLDNTGSAISPNILLDGSIYSLTNTPVDVKLCNFYQSEWYFVVESISEYLSRLDSLERTPGSIVTILLPKEGYTSGSPYNLMDTSVSSIAPNYNVKYYSFIDGVSDANFVEVSMAGAWQLAVNEELEGPIDITSGHNYVNFVEGEGISVVREVIEPQLDVDGNPLEGEPPAGEKIIIGIKETNWIDRQPKECETDINGDNTSYQLIYEKEVQKDSVTGDWFDTGKTRDRRVINNFACPGPTSPPEPTIGWEPISAKCVLNLTTKEHTGEQEVTEEKYLENLETGEMEPTGDTRTKTIYNTDPVKGCPLPPKDPYRVAANAGTSWSQVGSEEVVYEYYTLEGESIDVDVPCVFEDEVYSYISIPTELGKPKFIDSFNMDVTKEFSPLAGEDIKAGFQNNTVYKQSSSFYSAAVLTYKLEF